MPANSQVSFNGGEISDKLRGRGEIKRYRSSLNKLKNAICLTAGPITRRPGFEFINSTKDSSKKAALIPFVFSTNQAYMLEFGDLYLRFYRLKDIINPDAWAAGTYALGEQVQKDGVRYVVTAASTTQMPPHADWATKATLPYEIATPWTEAEVLALDVAQSADTLFIASQTDMPYELIRLGHAEWTITEAVFDVPPFLTENTDVTSTLQASAATGSVNLTASAATFDAGWVGSYIKIRELSAVKHALWTTAVTYGAGAYCYYAGSVYYSALGGTPSGPIPPIHLSGIESDGAVLWEFKYSLYGWAKITGYTSSTVVVATVIYELPRSCLSPNTEHRWSESAWSPRNGYPGAVTFHQERLMWSKHPKFPEQTWASRTGLYRDHHAGIPVVSSDAIDVTLATKASNAIQWIISGSSKNLVLGTTGAEWMISGTGGAPITPLDKRANPGSRNGSSDTKPVAIEHAILFIQQHGKILKELLYSWEKDAFVTQDLTILAEHLTRDYGITHMVFQRSPFSAVWCIRADGMLLGLTYYKDQEVWGWHQHDVGGTVESVATIPGTNEDELWIIVKRYVNGALVRYVECMGSDFTGTDTLDAFFLDSGATHDGRLLSNGSVREIDYIVPGAVTTLIVTKAAHGLSAGDSIRFREVEGILDTEGKSLLNGYDFNIASVPTSTKVYITLDTSAATQYEGSGSPVGWDASKGRLSGIQKVFQTATPLASEGFCFDNTGLKMFVADPGNDAVYQFALTTPWDISTLNTTAVRSVSITGDPKDIHLKSDGTRVYIVNDAANTVKEYSLSIPWDIGTMTYVDELDVSSETTTPKMVRITDDGLTLYVLETSADTIFQYVMGTAWSLSTASYDSKSYVITEDATPESFAIKPDGTKLWVIGSTTKKLYQYTLSSAKNISTASYDTVSFDTVLAYQAMFVKSSGDKVFLVENVGADSVTFFDTSGDSSGNVGRNITSLTNLGHLVGETVDLLIDGAPAQSQVVDNAGAVTLPFPGSVVHGGLGYESDIETLPPMRVNKGGEILPGIKQRPVSAVWQL